MLFLAWQCETQRRGAGEIDGDKGTTVYCPPSHPEYTKNFLQIQEYSPTFRWSENFLFCIEKLNKIYFWYLLSDINYFLKLVNFNPSYVIDFESFLSLPTQPSGLGLTITVLTRWLTSHLILFILLHSYKLAPPLKKKDDIMQTEDDSDDVMGADLQPAIFTV